MNIVDCQSARAGTVQRFNARYAPQHSRFIVADGTTVQTGGFDDTSSAASRDAENVLVVRYATALSAQYAREWRRLWDEGVISRLFTEHGCPAQ